MKRGWFRKTILWIHLILGLPIALILIVIGVTGSLLAFRDHYGRWANPSFYSAPTGEPLTLDAIIAKVEAEYAPSRVESIRFANPDAFQYFFLNDRMPVIVNIVDGRAFDYGAGQTWQSKLVIKANELHTKLAMGETGRIIRDFATFEVLFLIPTGIVLWWRNKRFSVKWKSTWFRRIWDLHSTIGIAIVIPIFFLAFTGWLIAFRLEPQWAEDSEPVAQLPAPMSASASAETETIAAPLDAAFKAAETELPGLKTFEVVLPEHARAAIAVHRSEAGWATRGHRSTVYVDQYSGKVLRVDRARPYSSAYNLYSTIKHLHTGEVFGKFGMAILMVSSFLFAVLAATGLALGVWKFVNWRKRAHARTEITSSSKQ